MVFCGLKPSSEPVISCCDWVKFPLRAMHVQMSGVGLRQLPDYRVRELADEERSVTE
jgi:hypothetical protein